MERFSIDESGYTGADLLNADQRWQGASAISITNDEATALIRKHFPKMQAPELKYSGVGKWASYKEPVLNLVRDVVENHKAVTYICDKRFLLMLQYVDYAIEPFYFERGTNLYEDGANYTMASLMYRTEPTMLGPDVFNGIMAAFQKAMKEKSKEAITDLVNKIRASKWETTFPEGWGPMAEAYPEVLAAVCNPETSTDAALVVLQSLINRTEAMCDGPYRIEHDQSKNLLQYNEILRTFIDNKDEIEFKHSEIATMRFPLKLTEVGQVDSKQSPAVQVADVMIGSAIDAANIMSGVKIGQVDPAKLMGLYKHEQLIHMVPSLDFEEQKKFRQGTQAAEQIEYISKMLAKKKPEGS